MSTEIYVKNTDEYLEVDIHDHDTNTVRLSFTVCEEDLESSCPTTLKVGAFTEMEGSSFSMTFTIQGDATALEDFFKQIAVRVAESAHIARQGEPK